jgi:hypothetical protein
MSGKELRRGTYWRAGANGWKFSRVRSTFPPTKWSRRKRNVHHPNHCCFPKQYATKMFYCFLEYQPRKTEYSGFNPRLLRR